MSVTALDVKAKIFTKTKNSSGEKKKSQITKDRKCTNISLQDKSLCYTIVKISLN